MSVLPEVLNAQAVATCYGLRDMPAARKVMRQAGAFVVAGRLVVRADDLDQWEQAQAEASRGVHRFRCREHREAREARSTRAIQAAQPNHWLTDGGATSRKGTRMEPTKAGPRCYEHPTPRHQEDSLMHLETIGQPRRGWRETVEPGLYRVHRVSCPRSADRRSGGRCACPVFIARPGGRAGCDPHHHPRGVRRRGARRTAAADGPGTP